MKIFVFIIFLLMFSFFSSCQNLESFEGQWRGRIVQTELLRKGLGYCTDVVLNIRRVTSVELDADIKLVKNQSSVCSSVTDSSIITLPSDSIQISLIQEFFNDTFSKMKFDDEPLFTQISFINLESYSAMLYISYFKGPKITIRIISSDIYAIFDLKKNN